MVVETPQEVRVGGEKFLLSQNGWAVHGPRIQQSLALGDGKPVTKIRTANFSY
jgi:hypothetical protein